MGDHHVTLWTTQPTAPPVLAEQARRRALGERVLICDLRDPARVWAFIARHPEIVLPGLIVERDDRIVARIALP